jgi:chitinase
MSAAITSLALSLTTSAKWPEHVFAPYMYVGSGDRFDLSRCDDACGQKYYTLAFIIAGKDGAPTWDGREPMEKNFFAEQIATIRSRGGDVIMSFGGEAGQEVALMEPDVAALEAKYAAVIDRYHLTWVDFDIEGRALKDKDANHRRNAALARLQASHPGLIVSYTLPVDPDGIPAEARQLLTDARTSGVKVYAANLMTMDYGAHFPAGKTMSAVSIASTLAAFAQCQAIAPDLRIGLTAMIGQNDEKGEVFTLDDARTFIDWAKMQPWVCSVSFWSINRDNAAPGKGNGTTRSGIAQEPWAFTRIFQTFQR